MKKAKKTRNAYGTKYSADLVSETARTKNAETPEIPLQHEFMQNASEKSLDNFKKLKSKKYQEIDLSQKGIFATIQKGGKFITFDGIKFATYTQKQRENSGYVRDETDVYFPQTDERKLVGSITSLRNRVETQRKRLVKLGML